MDVNQILLVVAAIGAVGVAAGLVLSRMFLWAGSLVVLLLALCCHQLYPPRETLKFGLDLAGGTSLLYEVSVPDGMNAEDAIRQTIETLKRRVDPEGVRNLEWHQESNSRIEVRMPRPSPEVQDRRARLQQVTDSIEQSNISTQAILNAVTAAEPNRPALFRQLIKGVEGRRELLVELAEARQYMTRVRSNYDKEPADSEARPTMARNVALAERAYDQALAEVQATNLDLVRLQQVMSMPAEPTREGELSPRQRALDRLKAEHPLRVNDIEAYVEAHAAYDAKKGPLDDPEDLKRLMRGAGVLDFRLTVDPQVDNLANIDDIREQLQEKGPASFTGSDYVWVEIDDLSMFAKTSAEREAAMANTAQYFMQRGGYVAERYGESIYMLMWNTLDKSITHRPEQEGWEVDSVRRQPDPRTFFPAVGVNLNTRGGILMGKLTRAYTKRQMGMVLDGKLLSAPVINSAFSDQFLISGGENGFTPHEQDYLVRTLGAGSLLASVSPEPIAVRTVGPSLGEDNLQRGLGSALYALIAIGVFMMLYYLFSGAVAGVALVSNILIVLAVMATPFITGGASFTLPGIAGIVLTMGMCVDANVLIFERIREELLRGADSETATRLGYQRAFSSIIDSNLTNLIVCIILYQTATVEVRGFAVTLGIGIVATLFTSLLMTRLIFQAWSKSFGGLGGLMHQLPTVIPAIDKLLTPSIHWISKRHLFFGLSAILIVGSLTMIVERGANLLDIEFRGGTEVAFELGDGNSMTLDEARARRAQIAELFTADTSQLAGQEVEISRGLQNMVTDRRRELLEIRTEKLQAQDKPVDTEALQQEIARATDLSQLRDATVVSIGDATDGEYDSFSLVSTVEDQQVVSSAIKREFADVLDVQGRLNFTGEEIEDAAAAPVYPVDRATLGEVIGRQAAQDVSAFRGGMAIVIEDIDPAQTLDSIRQRLRAMRYQPDFESLASRERQVMGIDHAPGDLSRYTSVAVVVNDQNVSYFNDPGAWDAMAQNEWDLVTAALTRDTSLSKVSNFTPTVARTLRDQAIVALVLSFIAIVVYIWFRFGTLRYGMAAIVALFHDVTIALGCVAATHFLYDKAFGEALLLGEFKLNLGLIAALLTIVGYSLNDTIVLFDRIRENRGKLAYASHEVINRSINQTISRTALTSLTTLLAVGVLYAFGGEGIRGFAFTLIVGVLVGTYSSIAIAAPLIGLGAKPSSSTAPAIRRDESASTEPAPAGA